MKLEFIKVAILNNSGNVGKSTICHTFLHPRIPNSEVVRVETINDDGVYGEKMSSKDMTSVIEKIDILDKVIIDVGSSNIENFIKGLKENSGSHEDIDFYFVPVTPETKQQKDTCNTVDELLDMGVEPNNIHLILNKVDTTLSLDVQFKLINESGLLKSIDCSTLESCIQIPDTEIFTLIERINTTYYESVNDYTDYRAEIRKTSDKDIRSALSIKKSCHRLAKAFDERLDIEFKKIERLL